MSERASLGRRSFLQAGLGAVAGLVIGCRVEPPQAPPAGAPPAQSPEAPRAEPAPSGPPKALNAWVRVAPDGAVTILVHQSEMGQGIETAIAMLVAEELEVELGAVRTEFAAGDPAYANPNFHAQITGGSQSVRTGWEPLQRAGAAARVMLVEAAARGWGVEASACRAEKGEVIHAASGRRAGYGSLVIAAAALPVPKEPPLKAARERRLLGTRPARVDSVSKVTGQAEFGIDVRRPGMLTAVVVRCPVIGGKHRSFDAAKAEQVKGVRKVIAIDSGVAVLADHFFAARRGAEALSVVWDEGPNAKLSTEELSRAAAALAKKPGKVAAQAGDAEKALKGAAAGRRLEAVYEVPYQAHAPMEPLSCTVELTKDGCDVWVGTQAQSWVQGTVSKALGIPPASVRVHTTYLGGAFGRRAEQDFVLEAAQLAKAAGVPVKVMWSREEDIRHDFYRPGSYNVLRGALGADGSPVAWTHRIVSPSILTRLVPPAVKNGLDHTSTEGADHLPYEIPNLLVDYHLHNTGVPVGFWRSVGHSQNAFVVECFLDELAALAKQDPFEYRRRLVAKEPRMLAALALAAEKAGWSKPLAASGSPDVRRGRGIAMHESFGSFVAQVAEVSVAKDGEVKVDRVVCAVDCGEVVHPGIVEAQIEGAIAFGLTATLRSGITIEQGKVKQGNFHNFKLLRFDEMPVVEVHLVSSSAAPGGIGEPGTPPIAPAVVNAIAAATGRRLRRLPVRAADLKA